MRTTENRLRTIASGALVALALAANALIGTIGDVSAQDPTMQPTKPSTSAESSCGMEESVQSGGSSYQRGRSGWAAE